MKQSKIDLAKICKPSAKTDWVRVYKESFPPEEQWSVEMLCADPGSRQESITQCKSC